MLEPAGNHHADRAGPAARPLSAREIEVLEMALLGRTNAEIALQLGVTTHAIKFHLSSIYRKLGVTNRTEAAVAYVRGSLGAAG